MADLCRYVPKEVDSPKMDKPLTTRLLQYAQASGYAAVLITVDQQAPGNRWRCAFPFSLLVLVYP